MVETSKGPVETHTLLTSNFWNHGKWLEVPGSAWLHWRRCDPKTQADLPGSLLSHGAMSFPMFHADSMVPNSRPVLRWTKCIETLGLNRQTFEISEVGLSDSHFEIQLLFGEKTQEWNLESGPPHYPVHIMQRERVHKTVVPLSSMNIFAFDFLWEPRCPIFFLCFSIESTWLRIMVHWNSEVRGPNFWTKSWVGMCWSREWSTLMFAVLSAWNQPGRTWNNMK